MTFLGILTIGRIVSQQELVTKKMKKKLMLLCRETLEGLKITGKQNYEITAITVLF